MKVKDNVVEIDCNNRKTLSSRNPLQRLRELVKAYKQQPVRELPPFQGGAAGMLSYDFVHYLEKLPATTTDDLDVPDAHFFMIDRLIAFDHAEKKSWIIVCPGARQTVLGFSEVTNQGMCWLPRLRTFWKILREGLVLKKQTAEEGIIMQTARVKISCETEKEKYMDMVKKAKEYIAAGDIFQANLSLRVSADIGNTDPCDIYAILRKINPSPLPHIWISVITILSALHLKGSSG